MNETGWAACVFKHAHSSNSSIVFPRRNVDFGTNLQSWTNKDCLELETLGEYKTLELEESIVHQETWFFAENIPTPKNDDDVKKKHSSINPEDQEIADTIQYRIREPVS
jgi:hypothetical protein